MSLEEDFDLGGMSKTDIDSDGMIRAGWHLAEVTDVYEERDSGNAPPLGIDFKVVAGPCVKATLKEKLWHPLGAKDADAAEKCRGRRRLFASRLGLINVTDAGKAVKINWLDAVGKRVVIQCEEREYIKKDGTKGKGTNLAYSGIYPPDHDKLPLDVRKTITQQIRDLGDDEPATVNEPTPQPPPTSTRAKPAAKKSAAAAAPSGDPDKIEL